MKKLALILSISFGIVSCHDDLDQVPTDPDSFTETLLPDRFFAKYDYELNNLPCGKPLSKEGFDFLKKVLVWDKESRLDTNACLKHPWISKKINK